VSNNRVAVGAEIPKGGFAQWLQEKLSGLNAHAMYIHTKYMILDPLSAAGTVISGSANFSDPSILKNDENSIVVVGDEYVNDVYLTEFMRLFSHFAFRAAQTKQTQKTAEAHGAVPDVIYLQDSDDWFARFYQANSSESPERKYFSGS